ncbi:ankyrin repeat domain-containing protein, partial [Candidatus Jidaibacter acanthamoebae]|uniref:ankyrin repeat domain-containing protein n=1 Tax=Candidatus Jidaibacter acanthamoebae TaxID=86105 RepID=UPI001955422F
INSFYLVLKVITLLWHKMKELTLQEVLGLHSDKVLFFLGLEDNVYSASENILYLHEKTNNKAHEIKSILQAIYKNKLVDPLKIFVNFKNRKLAVFHLERLRRTKNILDVGNELLKITFLNTKQKELLKQFMMLFHELDTQNINIIESYKADISRLADKILLSLINYINRLDLSKSEIASSNPLNLFEPKDPDSGYSRHSILKEVLHRYADSKELINLLELISEGEVEQVKQTKLKGDIPKEYMLLITDLINFDGNTEMMKALVEHVLLDKLDKSMIDSLLAKAVRYKNIDLAKYFLERGADPNFSSALYGAVIINRIDIIRLLLKYKANPNGYSAYCVPLIQATYWSYKDIVGYLPTLVQKVT